MTRNSAAMSPFSTLTLCLLGLALFALSSTAQAKKYCGAEYTKMQKKVCAYDGQEQPCLAGPHQSRRVQEQCCGKGCSLADIQQACCFSESCLKSCYPHLPPRSLSGKKHNTKMGGVY